MVSVIRIHGHIHEIIHKVFRRGNIVRNRLSGNVCPVFSVINHYHSRTSVGIIPTPALKHIQTPLVTMQTIGHIYQRPFRLVSQMFRCRLAHNAFLAAGKPLIRSVHNMCSFLAVGLNTTRTRLAVPEMIIHYVVMQPRAIQTVIRKSIYTVIRQQHIFYRSLFATGTQPVTVRKNLPPQIKHLNTVMGGKIRRTPVNGNIVYRLFLRHVFVVQIADILHAVRVHQIQTACLVRNQQHVRIRVIGDTRYVRAMQTRLTVVGLQLLCLLVHAEQTAVRNRVHTIRSHRYLCHVVVRKMRTPCLRVRLYTTKRTKRHDYYVT